MYTQTHETHMQVHTHREGGREMEREEEEEGGREYCTNIRGTIK